MKAPRNKIIVQWDEPSQWALQGGFLVPSEGEKREMLRRKDRKILIAGEVPDIYRWGTLIDGDCDAPIGSEVYFNKHDADAFKMDNKTYYSIPVKNALGWRQSTAA